MPKDNTRFRVDILPEIPGELCPKKYRIPCGMNSIVYIGAVSPDWTIINSPRSGMVLIQSEWSNDKLDYIPYRIIFPAN